MTKIKELIEDFKLNQEILGREKKYVELCMFRLYRWEKFTVKILGITETEDVTQLHIKKYIQERQNEGREMNRTINNNIATLKVFFQYLVSEEFIDEQATLCGGLEISKKIKQSLLRSMMMKFHG
ncbi:site-specific integrase [Paenibacillus sp. FSL L8-0493]|uniref:site-specific integrase n=1 Tax=unclassified Paenibacillus TaxID=185978 RepID=UPI0030FAE2C5